MAKKTKPESTEFQRKAKREAVVMSVIWTVLRLVSGTALWCVGGISALPGWLCTVARVLAVLTLLSVLSVGSALRDRFKEIEGGELDAARQY